MITQLRGYFTQDIGLARLRQVFDNLPPTRSRAVPVRVMRATLLRRLRYARYRKPKSHLMVRDETVPDEISNSAALVKLLEIH
jgi:hypothetical protein